MSNRILGIDLGTVNSCVAVVEDGRAVVLSDDGRRTIPSCLALQRDREIVGHAAKRQEVTDPLSTVSAVKRILGHRFESREVQTVVERVPYRIEPSPVGSVLLEIGGRQLTPIQISARILQRIREVAENALSKTVQKAVVCVPAHFTDIQRKATKLAAEYAGIEVVRLLNEPTAAAFAYGYRKGGDLKLAVYDLGGGTFDITVMVAQGDCFKVEATDGDSFLGGEDLDRAITEWLMEQFQSQYGHDLRGNETAVLRLKEAAEKAKIELSAVEATSLELPFLAQLEDGSRPVFSCTLTREKLEELAQPVIEKTLELCANCLEAAGLQPGEIDAVLLVGGQSRMAGVRSAVRDFFGTEPRRDIDPDEVVAIGAALYGYSLIAEGLKEDEEAAAGEAYAVACKDAEVVRRVVDEVEKLRSRSLDDRALAERLEELLRQTEADGPADDLPTPDLSGEAHLPEAVDNLVEKIAELDRRAEDIFDQISEELGGDLDDSTTTGTVLDRAVRSLSEQLDSARSEAQEAREHLEKAEVHGSARKVTLIDVTSHPLGIASAGDLFCILIDRNVPIPVSHTRGFTTNQDGQSEVGIRVHQGRSARASENQLLGEFILQGIAPAPRMEPRIDVEFSIDENGILSVRARDARSGKEQAMRIEDPLKLQRARDEDGTLTFEG
ncbi:MAG: Hsp70 family protein [Myxococcota bacterium]